MPIESHACSSSSSALLRVNATHDERLTPRRFAGLVHPRQQSGIESQLEILKQGVAAWNEWRRRDIRVDISATIPRRA